MSGGRETNGRGMLGTSSINPESTNLCDPCSRDLAPKEVNQMPRALESDGCHDLLFKPGLVAGSKKRRLILHLKTRVEMGGGGGKKFGRMLASIGYHVKNYQIPWK